MTMSWVVVALLRKEHCSIGNKTCLLSNDAASHGWRLMWYQSWTRHFQILCESCARFASTGHAMTPLTTLQPTLKGQFCELIPVELMLFRFNITHVYIYIYMFICMYICMYVYMHVCIYACMYICTYVYMHVCIYACMCVCMYYMYI